MEFEIGDKVQLKADMDNVYERAVGGSLGYVEDSKEDEFGYEMIHIEWDLDDWRYHGQSDGWAFANHFRLAPEIPIGPPSVDMYTDEGPDEKDPQESLQRFLESIKAFEGEEDDRVPDEAGYLAALEQGIDILMESDSFMLICTKRFETEQGVVFAPAVVTASQDDIAELILDSQMVQMAASSHYKESMRRLRETLERELDDGEDPPEEE